MLAKSTHQLFLWLQDSNLGWLCISQWGRILLLPGCSQPHSFAGTRGTFFVLLRRNRITQGRVVALELCSPISGECAALGDIPNNHSPDNSCYSWSRYQRLISSLQ